MNPIWFQFIVDESRRHRLDSEHIHMASGSFFIAKGHQRHRGQIFQISINLVKMGKQNKLVIEDGWTEFIRLNDIQLGDVVEMYYFWDCHFREKVIRDGWVVEDGDDCVDDSFKIPVNNESRTFNTRFTEEYINKGMMYVPVAFARENLSGYPKLVVVEIVVAKTSNSYRASMQIKYDVCKNVVECMINEGVKSMISKEGFGVGQELTVEYFGDVKPLIFYIPK